MENLDLAHKEVGAITDLLNLVVKGDITLTGKQKVTVNIVTYKLFRSSAGSSKTRLGQDVAAKNARSYLWLVGLDKRAEKTDINSCQRGEVCRLELLEGHELVKGFVR